MRKDITKIKISKIDVARRQLETAIRLYFNGIDPISTHMLVAAAHQVLHDLAKHMGDEGTIIRSASLIKEEHRKEWRDMVCEAENFFKHADRDPKGFLEFNPDITEVFILDACSKYYEMTKEKIPSFQLFFVWFEIIRPGQMELSDEQKQSISEYRAKYNRENKLQFYLDYITVAYAIL